MTTFYYNSSLNSFYEFYGLYENENPPYFDTFQISIVVPIVWAIFFHESISSFVVLLFITNKNSELGLWL